MIRPIASNISSDSHNVKGSIDFYALLNDLAIQRFHDKVPASASISLTKAQRTR